MRNINNGKGSDGMKEFNAIPLDNNLHQELSGEGGLRVGGMGHRVQWHYPMRKTALRVCFIKIPGPRSQVDA